MKYSCDMMRDLIPLYLDKVCSKDSQQAVEEHLNECGDCKAYYDSLKQTEQIDELIHNDQFEEQQVNAIKQVKKKINKKINSRGKLFGITGIVIGIIVTIGVCCFSIKTFSTRGTVGALLLDMLLPKVEVYTDISKYEDYIGKNAKDDFKNRWGMDTGILPEKMTSDMEVKDFQFVYYNPWDAQYVTYLTVAYNDEDYAKEVKRLNEKGIEEYKGYYSVTGEPKGYDLLAMNSDSYQGFVYAMTPENGEKSITYIEIVFCNYFLDLDIHKYMPEQYLLEGFDASSDNPYALEKRKVIEEQANRGIK